MSRDISSNLKAHLEGATTTLAVGIRLETIGGDIFGFTTHTKPTLIAGVTYEPSTAITPTSIESKVSTGVDNMEMIGIISSDTLTEKDILAGRFDNAKVQVFIFNYKAVADGILILAEGAIGEMQVDGLARFKAEVRSKTQLLSLPVLQPISATCRVRVFGDAECDPPGGKNAYRKTGTVATVINQRIFTVTMSTPPATGYFNFGEFVWTSGDNEGLPCPDVMLWDESLMKFSLMSSLRYTIQVGDTFEVFKGCDRLPATCIGISNMVNFRGEPHVPGPDFALQIIGGG